MTFGPCADHNPDPPYDRTPRAKGERCETCARIATEGKIARRAIKDLLAAGYSLGVFDGEECTVERSRDAAAVEAAMFTTDDDWLLVYHDDKPDGRFGWVRFVYGNSGWDVICDYTTNLEGALEGVNAYAESLDR